MTNATNEDKALALRLAIHTQTIEAAKKIPLPDYASQYTLHTDTIAQWISGSMIHPKHGEIAYVGIRGSDDPGDWLLDFDVKKIRETIVDGQKMIIPYGNTDSKIRMHEGVIKHYGMIRTAVRSFVKQAVESGITKIWILGHSLGGGDTGAAFVDIHYMLSDTMKLKINDGAGSVDLTGFANAMLRIGNGAFARSFNRRANGNFYNSYYGCDIVHDVPLWWWGYRHVKGQKRYADLISNLTAPILMFPHVVGLPSWAWFDHYPQRLLCALEGKRIPRINELSWK